MWEKFIAFGIECGRNYGDNFNILSASFLFIEYRVK